MRLVVLGLIGCHAVRAPAPDAPGSGSGDLGALVDTGDAQPSAWVGYDAARLSLDGEVVCDRVWDTVGEPVEVDGCDGCDFGFSLTATLRDGVGEGEADACPPASYTVSYAWRSEDTADGAAAGLLTRTSAGWVRNAGGSLDDDLLIAEGDFIDPETGVGTVFTVLGRLTW